MRPASGARNRGSRSAPTLRRSPKRGRLRQPCRPPPASAPLAEAPAEPPWNVDDEPGLFDDQAKEPPIEAQLQETHIDRGEPETESGPRATSPAETASIDATLGEDHFIEPDPALDAR